MRYTRGKTWYGVPLRKLVAELSMRPAPRVCAVHTFATCLAQMRDAPRECRQMRCIVALLIALACRRGCRLPPAPG